MRALYEGDISYLDEKLGDMLNFLRNANVLDNTLLILTSDHGENFGEHDLIEHQFCLYNSLLHVPLILRYPPKMRPGTRQDQAVSTASLFLTIADLLNIAESREFKNAEIYSLLNFPLDSPVYAEYENPKGMLSGVIGDEAPADFNFSQFDRALRCIYVSENKFIWASDGRFELYSVKNDWGENQNLLNPQDGEIEPFNGLLWSWHKNLWRPEFLRDDKKASKEAVEALKALGYIK
jgi:arylsulfatase A-like enzyme